MVYGGRNDQDDKNANLAHQICGMGITDREPIKITAARPARSNTKGLRMKLTGHEIWS
jgi:hypothetical protein